MGKEKKRYTDDDVAVALAFLKSAGYPQQEGAMDKASRHTGIPRNTLRRWYTGEMHPVGNELVSLKKIEMSDAIENELAEIFSAMGSARDEASYKDLTTAAGILIDKRQLLSGSDTAKVTLTVQRGPEVYLPEVGADEV